MSEQVPRKGYHLVFRGIASSTNRRTAIVSLVPSDVALNHTCKIINLADFGWRLPSQNDKPESQCTQTEMF